MGGSPVDRFAKLGMVDQAVALFDADDDFILGLAPEGTRKRVDTLRTGFYHIAKKARVPIIPIGLDYENKKLVIGDAFFCSDDEAADMKKVIAFFAEIKGRSPDADLRHLKK
jgi:1-acyl-sn-glycerol-3-phosphate acyltransferase